MSAEEDKFALMGIANSLRKAMKVCRSVWTLLFGDLFVFLTPDSRAVNVILRSSPNLEHVRQREGDKK